MPLPTDLRRCTAATATLVALAGCMHTPELQPPAPVVSAVILPPQPPAPPPPPPPPEPTPAERADAAARRLFAFQERLRELPPAEVARELGQRDPPSDAAATVELALLLAHNRTSERANGDLARAIALLDPLVRNGASPWQGPARLLHARLVEQRRLEEQVEKLAQQQREQARRIEQLASQLEALRAIERSLSAPRPATPAPAAPAAPPAATPPRTTP